MAKNEPRKSLVEMATKMIALEAELNQRRGAVMDMVLSRLKRTPEGVDSAKVEQLRETITANLGMQKALGLRNVADEFLILLSALDDARLRSMDAEIAKLLAEFEGSFAELEQLRTDEFESYLRFASKAVSLDT